MSLSIPAQPSICLGACDLPVFDMAGAYTTFANNGIANKPIFLVRIEDKKRENHLYTTSEERQLCHQCELRDGGYAKKCSGRGREGLQGCCAEYGGKTGTTNDYDGWFEGITSQGCWNLGWW
ncbi:MAG: penicillin-binding transpeptidase domain-containing protein [Saprospiraceae bacterium]